MKIKVNLEEVKRQLLEINPKDYFNKREISEIFKTAKDFKIEVGREGKYFLASDDPDKMVIQLTFKWEACPHPKKFGYEQRWYIDLKEYSAKERKNKIEKILK